MTDRTRRPVRTLGGTLLLVVAVLLSVIGLAPPSQAVDDAHITGTVTAGGAPVEGIQVTAYVLDEFSWGSAGSVATAADGTYELAALPAGTYRVEFVDYGGTFPYQAYNGAASFNEATDLEVGEDEVVTGIDAALEEPGSITGTVTNPGGGQLEGISVSAYEVVGESLQYAGGVSTGFDGSYDLTGLPPGAYRISFEDFSGTHLGEAYNNKSSIETGDDVLVSAGAETSGIDAQLATPSSISGTVTDGTNTLADISVSLYRDTEFGPTMVTSTSTGVDGGYVLEGLSPGTYRLGFEDFSGSFAPEYWNDQATLEAADKVVVGESQDVVGKDAELSAPGSIAGTVTGPGGVGLEDVNVTVHQVVGENLEYAGNVLTEPDGSYEVPSLAAGDYRVGFEDYSGAHQSEYWNDKPSMETADDVAVTLGNVTADIDAELATPSSIAGTVTDGTDPIEGISVTAYRAGEDGFDYAGFASTQADGSYVVPDLEPGTYRLGFDDYSTYTYAGEYWDDKGSLQEADDIVVGTSDSVTGKDAVLDLPGAIAGTVTDSHGAPLEDVNVTAYRGSGEDLEYVNTTTTGPDGSYEMGGLSAGADYRLQFEDYIGGHLSEYYDDKPTAETADPVTVSLGTVTEDVDAQLASPSTIAGRVSDAGHADLEGMEVTLWRQYDWGFSWADSTTTGADGTYTFTPVEPGTYRLGFDDPDGDFREEFWQDAATLEEADDIVVGTDEELVRDAQLNPASRIQGTVTAVGGAPLQSITVSVYGFDDDFGGSWNWLGGAETGVDGTYQVKGLEPGVYRIGFDDPAHQRVPEYWNDATTLRKAANIKVGDSQVVTGKDAVLPLGGAISGTVTAEGGGPLADVDVSVYDMVDGDPEYLTSTSTDASGDYTVSGLRAGEYRLRFSDYSGEHITEAWEDAANVYAGDDILVTGTATVADRDVELTPVSHIAGTVEGPSGPIGSVNVTAFQRQPDETWDQAGNVYTGSDGTYDLGGLEAGTYRLRFTHSDFIREYWNDKPLLTEADDLVLAAATTLPDVDAVLVASGTISGRVTGTGGTPLDGVEVTAYDAEGDPVSSGDTDDAGAYTVGGLDPGTYRLEFVDSSRNHLDEYYDDVDTLDAATPIEVAASQEVTGKDAELAAAGKITGTLTGPGGVGLEDAGVEVYRETPEGFDYVRQTGTGPSGSYTLKGLPTGTYRVYFDPPSLDLVGEYYDDAATLDEAEDIAVTAGQTTAGIDGALETAASIAGSVTAAGGAPLEDIDVTAYRVVEDGFEYARYTSSQADGSYRLRGLAPGTYRLEFDAPSGYADEYWDDAPSLAEATDVVVAAGAEVAGKDAVLAPRATRSISGVVTDPAGNPAPGIAVTVYRWDDEFEYFDWYDSVTTKGDGGYLAAGLPAGTYTLGFFDHRDGVFASEYWQDAATLETAATFEVADTAVTGKDAQLALGGTLSGKVRNPEGEPVNGVWVTVYRQVGDTFRPIHGTDSRTNGLYRIEGLPAGTYKLGFEPDLGGYAEEFYDNATTLAGATPLTLTAGETKPALDVALAAPTELVNLEAPMIFGSALVGSTLSADPGWWTPSGATFAYQWLVNGDPIEGATDDTYVVQASDLGDLISVRVTASKEGLTSGVATSAPEGPVQNPPLVSQTPPTVSGTTQVGFTLTADPGTWSPSDVTLAYQWLADGEPIASATGATYQLTSGELGATISVRVTASRSGYQPTPATSAGVGPVTSPPTPPVVNDTLPSISGVAQVGSTLTADPGTWTPSDATFAYQWRADGEPIGGATNATYVVAAGDLGTTISVRVTASKSGFTPGEATSAGKGPVVNPSVVNVTAPSVSGTAKVGQVLTANGGTWNPADAALAYQWRANGSNIVDANGTTYTPVAGDVGKTITVRVTASKAGYDQTSVTSAGVGPVTEAEAPAVSNVTAPSISGTPQVGEELTANGGTWDPADAALAYQWRAGPDDIAGATGTTYTPVAGDVGKTITVRVTASKPGFDPASATSAGVGPVTAAPLPAVTNVTQPSVSGVAKVGSVLTAVRGTWNPSDASTSVQWLVNGAPVAGATGDTFPLGAAHAGKTVSVRVTASKAGHTDGTATSTATASVALGTIVCSAVPKISGTAKVGKTLSVSKGTWAPASVKVTYQWLLNGKAIKGATKNKLKVTAKMKGKKLTVTVKAAAPGYVAKAVTTKPTKKIT